MTSDEPDRPAAGRRKPVTDADPRPPWSVNTAGILGLTAAGLFVVSAVLTPVGVPNAYNGITVVRSSTIGLGVVLAILVAVTVVILWLTPGKRRGPKLVLAWFFAAGCITSGFGLGTLPLIASTVFFAIPASAAYYAPPDAR